MATLTLADIRTEVKDRNSDLIDKLEVTNNQFDTFIRSGFRSLFPKLYKRVRQAGLTATDNVLTVANVNYLTSLHSTVCGRKVFIQHLPLTETEVELVNVGEDFAGEIVAYSIEPYASPADAGSVSFPDEWLEALYLGTEVKLFEAVAAGRVKYKGQRPNDNTDVDENEVLNLLNNIRDRFNQELTEREMPPPVGAL